MSFMHDIYTSPWCRIPPYLVGIILGYILHNTRKMPVKMNWVIMPFRNSNYLLRALNCIDVLIAFFN